VKPPHTFDRFSDADWAEIQRAAESRKDCPPGLNWTDVRLELEETGRDYWTLRRRRLDRPSAAEHKRVRHLIEQLQDLDIVLPRLGRQFKTKLKPAYRFLIGWDVLLSGHSKFFHGQADLNRTLLYDRVLLIWIGPLRGELKYSRGFDGKVSGPLPRFFAAVVGPILGPKPLKLEGIASIIDRERGRIARCAKWWDKFPGRRQDAIHPSERT
jgi:hypothetical protein